MMNGTARVPHDVISHVSPKSRNVRKTSSAERREKEKVTNRLRQLVAAEEDADHYALVLATIAHIREHQAHLNGKENNLPTGFEQFFSNSASVSLVSSRPESPQSSPESSPNSTSSV